MDLIDKIPYLKVNKIQQNETINIKEKQVLIVDDARDNSTILQKKLSTIGLGADIADSGKMALEMLKEKQYEVMFIDINMPVMNGEELFAEMCRLKIPGVKLAYTADAVKKTKNRLIKLGFDDVVRKPVQENILCGLVKHHLRPAEPEILYFKPKKK